MARELFIDARISVGGFAVDVELEVERGPLLLVGPNGVGKSTVLRALAGGAVAVDGCIEVAGRRLVHSSTGAWVAPEMRSVGYLPQSLGLFPHLTARDNVAFGVVAQGGEERSRIAGSWLGRMGLSEQADARPGHLSLGQRQRVALARALAREPRLLLLDEPLAALDVSARREARELVGRVMQGATRVSVVVTHDVRDIRAWAGQVVRVGADGVRGPATLDELMKGSGDPFLEELLVPLVG